MTGAHDQSLALAREALRLVPRDPNHATHIHAHAMVARIFAWAGAQDEAVAMLDTLSSRAPGVGPASIARDPFLARPLAENASWRILHARLEDQITANTALGS
jgi:hypothetical protein